MPEAQADPASAPFPGKSKFREGLTIREREVVALERISDQLALLCAEASVHMLPFGSMGGTERQDSPTPVGAWENEGGSMKPDRELPAGMTASIVTQYHVGAYSYSDFGHAFAELNRQGAAADTASR